jgi:hypothetical protein
MFFNVNQYLAMPVAVSNIIKVRLRTKLSDSDEHVYGCMQIAAR